MSTRGAFCFLVLATLLAGCATSGHRDAGWRVLDAIVVERAFEPAGGLGFDPWELRGGNDGSGNWYLVFEARDGEATARYRLSVSRQQYMLFPVGADVQITLVGYELRALRRRP